ncbi:histidine phosphatase family protein [Enterococcus saccharolyticus]|uniref:histidine phosphatase family protein n=1 Tax=Enterococcus saccharolyticus TaxID=41997 RepID=UPI001E4B805F|nr:histidine phosphatase family protein [Enterococcus saccharolyticus]MCD5001476.1 histidine phosphatase family protein [Enterococcus saccharolyticus]
MKLYFVRHGHTEWNESNRIQGSQDVDLSEKGILQAKKLANKLQKKQLTISKIYSSPQKRAIQTAKSISNKLAISTVVKEGLQEINLGLWEGLTWKEVQEDYASEFNVWFHNRRYQIAPEGESYQQLMVRVMSVLEEIIDQNQEDVLIVTHSAVIMCLQCLVHQKAFEQMDHYRVKNTEVIEFDDCTLHLLKSLI